MTNGHEPRWRRKTSHERLSDRRRRRRRHLNPLPPIMFAAFGAVMWTGLRMLVGDVRHGRPPISFAQALWELPVMFVVFLLGGYVGRAAGWIRSNRTRLTICTRCFDIAVDEGARRCVCGGPLDDADRWTQKPLP
jgi:hypothetical protein